MSTSLLPLHIAILDYLGRHDTDIQAFNIANHFGMGLYGAIHYALETLHEIGFVEYLDASWKVGFARVRVRITEEGRDALATPGWQGIASRFHKSRSPAVGPAVQRRPTATESTLAPRLTDGSLELSRVPPPAETTIPTGYEVSIPSRRFPAKPPSLLERIWPRLEKLVSLPDLYVIIAFVASVVVLFANFLRRRYDINVPTQIAFAVFLVLAVLPRTRLGKRWSPKRRFWLVVSSWSGRLAVLCIIVWQVYLWGYLPIKPPERVVILVTYFSEGQNPAIPANRTTNNLIFGKIRKLQDVDPLIKVERLADVFVGEHAAERARAVGRARGVTFVIWGDYSPIPLQPGRYLVTPHFELLQHRRRLHWIEPRARVVGPSASSPLSEPDSFAFTFGLDQELALFSAFTAGIIHGYEGKLKEAASDFAIAKEEITSHPDAVNAIPPYAVYFYSAWYAAVAGDCGQAIVDYTTALQFKPGSVTALNNRAICHLDLRHFDAAMQDAKQAIDLAPEFGQAYNTLGNVYYSSGNYELAVETYDEAIAVAPYLAPAYYNRGLAQWYLGRVTQALTSFGTAMNLDSSYAEPRIMRGAVFASCDDHVVAIAYYDSAEKVNPDLSEGFLYRGISRLALCLCEDVIDDALNDLNKAIRLDPENTYAFTYRARARLVTYAREREEGRAQGTTLSLIAADVERSLEIDQRNVDAYIVWGDALFYKGDFTGAVTEYAKAISMESLVSAQQVIPTFLAPDFAIVYAHRGCANLQLGNYDDAIVDFTRALELEPMMSWAYLGRGKALLESGEADQAAKDFEMHLAFKPSASADPTLQDWLSEVARCLVQETGTPELEPENQ